MKLNECYSVPRTIIKELQDYDPALRLRWGRAEGIVRVERKVRRKYAYVPPVENFDDFVMIRDGYTLLFKFPPLEHLWPLVIYSVARTDLRRLGGADALADDLEAREQYENARKAWNRRDDFRVLSRDLYRHMNTVKTCPEGATHQAYGTKPGFFRE